MCVVVRDLIVYGVLTDMMRGRPAIYATFSSYDEVAHHSGLERADTLEALRKLDQQFGRIDNARRYAPRPYEIVVLSDHGQTQGATFKQRNGYGLDELVERSVRRECDTWPAVTSSTRWPASRSPRRRARGGGRKATKSQVGDRNVVVLGSGNLGLVYLMDEPRRLTLEEIEERHPRLISALREHPHVGWILVRSARARRLGARGAPARTTSSRDGSRETIRSRLLGPTRRNICCARTASRTSADLMIGSFYDPEMDEGCAFEELISFHGGLGGPQTQPFILHPASLEAPDEEIVGAEHVHAVLSGWRHQLQGETACNRPQPVSYSRANQLKEGMWLRKAPGQAGWRLPACS